MSSPSPVLLAALKEAMSQPGEQPLYKVGKQPGLFPGRSHAESARQAVADGLLEVTRRETRGKTELEWAKISPRGVQFVCQNESPKEVLEEFVHLLKENREGLPLWIQEMQAQLQGFINRSTELLERQFHSMNQLAQRAEEALRRIVTESSPVTAEGWQLDALHYLNERKSVANGQKCLLSELFGYLAGREHDISIGEFHLALGCLHDQGTVELQPFTGHLSELTEPEYALLQGSTVFHAVRKV